MAIRVIIKEFGIYEVTITDSEYQTLLAEAIVKDMSIPACLLSILREHIELLNH